MIFLCGFGFSDALSFFNFVSLYSSSHVREIQLEGALCETPKLLKPLKLVKISQGQEKIKFIEKRIKYLEFRFF